MSSRHPPTVRGLCVCGHSVGNEGGILGAIDLVRTATNIVTRDVTVACDEDHAARISAACAA